MAQRIAPLSGFPEYLPAARIVELRVIDTLRETFELHGFASIQTRSVEPLEQLSRKGEITKEVYAVRRLHADEGDAGTLGLHFDLTVPFARYVLENSGKLNFPFRRYQIQPAWRGERPQEGRYREFWQADIDIVGEDALAAHHDAEVVLVMLEALGRLHDQFGIPDALMRINNRKLIQGFYEGLGVADPLAVIQVVDKLDKIGPSAVGELLAGQGVAADVVTQILALASISSTSDSFIDEVRALGVTNDLLEIGLVELSALLAAVNAQFPGRAVVDLKIARGLDYYTGSVFEVELPQWRSLGTVSAGGRYDALASDGRHTYPGVGISFGVTRSLAPQLLAGNLSATRSTPSAVLVAVDDEESRASANAVAASLRTRGIPCEVSPNSSAYGKQIKYADRRGIPYVWFGGPQGQVKDIRTGSQADAQASEWTPPTEDLLPRVIVIEA
ncbi:MAG: histidine--tRNA ligase [Propionibacteriaceae bacterium]|jgi:histidyl-tRNA synthetase|nr:histidine--tRNA ligase [Propionibacteriaceae bacterium]